MEGRQLASDGESSVGIIVQARMGSKRLPGKSMLDLGGMPLIARVLSRLRKVSCIDSVILATTRKAEDDCLVYEAQNLDCEVYRGSESDLVNRYYHAAREFDLDQVVRVPADNFASDWNELEKLIIHHLKSDAHFTSNITDFWSNGYIDGVGGEIFRRECLDYLSGEGLSLLEREHLALNFIDYANPDSKNRHGFRIGTLQCPLDISRPDIHLDINTEADYLFFKPMYYDFQNEAENVLTREIISWVDWKTGKI